MPWCVMHGDLSAADGWVEHEGKRFEQTRFWGGIVCGEVHHEPWPWHVDFADELAEAARAHDCTGGVFRCETDHAVALEAPVELVGGGPW